MSTRSVSNGAVLLRAWRAGQRLSPNGAAKVFGTDRETYMRWESGAGVPTLRFAIPLEDIAGVSCRSWITPATEAA